MAEISRDPDDDDGNNLPLAAMTGVKREALEAYKAALPLGTCKRAHLTRVFADIKYVKEHPRPIQDRQVSSAADLLAYAAGGDALSSEAGRRILQDVIANCTTPLVDRMVEWLCERSDFGPDALVTVLRARLARFKEQSGGQLYCIEKLFTVCTNRSWDRSAFQDFTPIIEGLAHLLREAPEAAGTIRSVSTFIPQLSKDEKALLHNILEEKQRHHQRQSPGAAPIAFTLGASLQPAHSGSSVPS